MPVYDRPVVLQKIDEDTEVWTDVIKLHAYINKTKQSAYLGAGATQAKSTLTFEFRYNPILKEISTKSQLYRLIYDGNTYRILDYDDFQQRHLTVKLVAESY